MTECSTCGFPVEESDRFCGNCRTEMGISNVEQRTPNVEAEELSYSSTPCGEKPAIEFNASRVLLEGSVLPLEFRIHSEKKLSKVMLSVRSANGIHAERKVKLFSSGRDIALDVAVPKGCSGTLGFDVSLKARLEGKVLEFHGACRHEICPAAGDGGIHIDIQQGHAGDIQVSGLKELAARSDKRTLLRELNAIEPRWETLPTEVVSQVAAANGHESITVEAENGPIQLLNGSCLIFGRNRDNDIVTRLVNLSSAVLDPANSNNPNRFISGHHGWLHKTEEGVFVVDGDMVSGKPSGGGTFLDGKRMVREQLPTHSVTLSLSGEDASLPTIYSLCVTASPEGVVLGCPNRREGAFLWLFGALDFEGSTYEHRSDGFYADGKRI